MGLISRVSSRTYREMSASIIQKLKVFRGDICNLPDIQVIVNAANKTLQGGGGVDGAIHRIAGPGLRQESARLFPNGCDTSDACLTGSHNLQHAKAIIHTVGPVCRTKTPQENDQNALKACYINCLNVASEEKFDSVAFPCISTGVY